MEPHAFSPQTYTEAEHHARLAWARGYLKDAGIWHGFPGNTSTALADLHRQMARLGTTLPPVLLELAQQGHPIAPWSMLAQCLPSGDGRHLAARLLRMPDVPVDYGHFLISQQTDIHDQMFLCREAIKIHRNDIFDLLAPAVAKTFYETCMDTALSAHNAHAGIWLLANSPGMKPLDFARKRNVNLDALDQFWAQGLAEGRIAPPPINRPMTFWRKRLPCVNAYLKARALSEMAAQPLDKTDTPAATPPVRAKRSM